MCGTTIRTLLRYPCCQVQVLALLPSNAHAGRQQTMACISGSLPPMWRPGRSSWFLPISGTWGIKHWMEVLSPNTSPYSISHSVSQSIDIMVLIETYVFKQSTFLSSPCPLLQAGTPALKDTFTTLFHSPTLTTLCISWEIMFILFST